MLTIKAQATAGSSIGTVFEQAKDLGKKLGCYVEFDFNGVRCCARYDGDTALGIENYQREIRKDGRFQYATNF